MAEPTAFRTFAVDPPYAARTIRKRLADRIADLMGQFAGGYVKDWSDYQKRVGVIEGLTEAIAICDDMEKQEKK